MQNGCMQVGIAAAVRHQLEVCHSGRLAWLSYLRLGRLQDFCQKACITDLQQQVCRPVKDMCHISHLSKSPAWHEMDQPCTSWLSVHAHQKAWVVACTAEARHACLRCAALWPTLAECMPGFPACFDFIARVQVAAATASEDRRRKRKRAEDGHIELPPKAKRRRSASQVS